MSGSGKSHKVATSKQHFRLTELPGELRNRVYGFLLTVPNHVQKVNDETPATSIIDTGIFLVSRTVYAEASAVFFRANIIQINAVADIKSLVGNETFVANVKRVHIMARGFASLADYNTRPIPRLIILVSDLQHIVTFVEFLRIHSDSAMVRLCYACFPRAGSYDFGDGSESLAAKESATVFIQFLAGIYLTMLCSGNPRLSICHGRPEHVKI
ncbi:MAG: hypothetical protein M1812_005662 [Candelaria pacifica]|nr:MAG: hypothetical protein M1812_005662 [Candelaria pacifica]